MKKTLVVLLAAFKYSPDGMKVIELEPGEHELPERAAQVAREMGIVDDSEAKRQAEEEAATAKAAAEAEQKRQAEEEAANANAPSKATEPPIQPSKAPAKNKAPAKADAGAK
ncbi:hypothetical protein [Halopseudomonas salina]|uniref:Uncharacterized protein n=1 Tax=Halopseudomonas salina TaxID=1323744 RepID=A0ABQ1P201_9GAMM|nr:hypothetical protein [Halopseudomonas salina]GGC87389.1 hypothetical protein GCM10007418_03920 [Halopseudomonas salina]